MAFRPPWRSKTGNEIDPGDTVDDRRKAQTRGLTSGAKDWGDECCMKVITWNVNNRLGVVSQQVQLLGQHEPDVVALQDVTLRRDWKARGFFRLSSVCGMLRNAAWLRLGIYRSGGGKARNSTSIHALLFLGGAMPVDFSMPGVIGRWPIFAFGILGVANT
jgi:hypothetical protein